MSLLSLFYAPFVFCAYSSCYIVLYFLQFLFIRFSLEQAVSHYCINVWYLSVWHLLKTSTLTFNRRGKVFVSTILEKAKMLNGINVPNMSHILELEDLRPDHQNLVFIILKTLGFFQFKTKFSSLVFLEPIGCITIVVTTQLVLLQPR